nr:hypothetical protein [Providencia rettgeri]
MSIQKYVIRLSERSQHPCNLKDDEYIEKTDNELPIIRITDLLRFLIDATLITR